MSRVKQVIVTGASGFIGRKLVQALAQEYQVLAIDIRSPDEKINDVTYLKLNCANREHVEKFFQSYSHRIAAFYNLAAYYNFNNLPSEHDQALLDCLPIIAEGFKKYATDDAIFVQASSMASLMPVEPGVDIKPDAPSFERWTYPAFKKRSEDVLRGYLKRNRYIEFVIAGVYSEYCELVPLFHFMEAHLQKQIYSRFHPASLNRGLTYIHRSDLIDAFRALLKSGTEARRLLIGEAQATTYQSIVDAIDKNSSQIIVPKWSAKLGARLLNLIRDNNFYQPWMIDYSDEHYQFDISSSVKNLGWKPRHQLKNELPSMVFKATEDRKFWLSKNHQRPWSVKDWEWLNFDT